MKTSINRLVAVFIVLHGFTDLRAQQLITNEIEKGYLKDGNRYSVWEYYDKAKALELKIDHNSGRVYYLKPDASKFAIYKDSGWVMEKIRVYPIPVEGYQNLYKKLQDNMHYPAEALEAGAEAEIFVVFEIDEQGTATNFSFIQDLGYGFEKEITKTLAPIQLPWVSARVNGVPVRARFILPLQYSIHEQKIFPAPLELPVAKVLEPVKLVGSTSIKYDLVSREVPASSYSLSKANASMMEGVIVKKNGESVACLVELVSDYGKKVNYKLTADAKEQSMKITDVKSLVTPYNVYENVRLGDKEKLMILVVDGNVKLYKHVTNPAGTQAPGSNYSFYGKPTVTYALKKDTAVHIITERNFDTLVPELIRDNPKLHDRVQIKNFTYNDIEDIVYEYVHNAARLQDKPALKNGGRDRTDSLEIAPSFPGGAVQMLDFIRKNMSFPLSARRMGIDGTVFLSFIVEEDGTITNITVTRGISADCDREAVRVVSIMPKWRPAMQNGKPVRVNSNLYVKFKLN
jgi:TonB family protein